VHNATQVGVVDACWRGWSRGLTPVVDMQFMGVIEARAAEILQRFTIIKANVPGSPPLKSMLAGTLGPTYVLCLVVSPFWCLANRRMWLWCRLPSGILKQHIQASVMRLACIDDANLGDDGLGPDGDFARPLTSEELRRSAQHVLGRASSLAVESASEAAVQALSHTLPSVHTARPLARR